MAIHQRWVCILLCRFFGSRFDNLANLGRDDQTRNETVHLLADLATVIAKVHATTGYRFIYLPASAGKIVQLCISIIVKFILLIY